MVDQENAKSLKNGNKVPALWGWHTYVSIAITVFILGCLAAMLDLKEIYREIAATDKKFLVLGGLAHYATYPVRGWRWRRCLLHLSPKGGADGCFTNSCEPVHRLLVTHWYGASYLGSEA